MLWCIAGRDALGLDYENGLIQWQIEFDGSTDLINLDDGECCDNFGSLLVFDEVMCGFRTQRSGTHEWIGVVLYVFHTSCTKKGVLAV